MATKTKGRIAPDIDFELLTETFAEQLPSGLVSDATASDTTLPPLHSPRGQPIRVERCVWSSVTLADPKAHGLRMQDARIDNSDLANVVLTAVPWNAWRSRQRGSPAQPALRLNSKASSSKSASWTSLYCEWSGCSSASSRSAF